MPNLWKGSIIGILWPKGMLYLCTHSVHFETIKVMQDMTGKNESVPLWAGGMVYA